jgi:deoxyribodipyrimidine photo-lyase
VERAVVLFTRDLRLHDHPPLHAALAAARQVIPLFVLDHRFVGVSPNRTAFLLDSLNDLRSGLRRLGGELVVRRGDAVDETLRIAREHGAAAVFTGEDVTPAATVRHRRLGEACGRERIALTACAGVTVVPAGELRPAGGDHYRVFTPYWRAWRSAPRRAVLPRPRRIEVPPAITAGPIPRLGDLVEGDRSPDLCRGGETHARRLLHAWDRSDRRHDAERHDDLAADRTSRLSPYLHFGCLSPLEVAERLDGRPGGAAYIRQLCWRDFHHQVTAAFGTIRTREYRPRGDRWRRSGRDLEAWQSGCTGYPVVDAGMRQLRQEGWMHNRARLITASFLAKDLYLDWRLGERHFFHWLVDGDVANNGSNWQWVAGTGNDTRPNRTFNPLRQALRFDPDGDYVRRYVPELAGVDGAAVHQPWLLDAGRRTQLDYPEPIVDHDEAMARFRAKRADR